MFSLNDPKNLSILKEEVKDIKDKLGEEFGFTQSHLRYLFDHDEDNLDPKKIANNLNLEMITILQMKTKLDILSGVMKFKDKSNILKERNYEIIQKKIKTEEFTRPSGEVLNRSTILIEDTNQLLEDAKLFIDSTYEDKIIIEEDSNIIPYEDIGTQDDDDEESSSSEPELEIYNSIEIISMKSSPFIDNDTFDVKAFQVNSLDKSFGSFSKIWSFNYIIENYGIYPFSRFFSVKKGKQSKFEIECRSIIEKRIIEERLK